MSDKELAIQAVQRLPDTVSLNEIEDEISLIAALRDGVEQADARRLTPHSQVKDLLGEWISK